VLPKLIGSATQDVKTGTARHKHCQSWPSKNVDLLPEIVVNPIVGVANETTKYRLLLLATQALIGRRLGYETGYGAHLRGEIAP
jgi:hypothetical protein